MHKITDNFVLFIERKKARRTILRQYKSRSSSSSSLFLYFSLTVLSSSSLLHSIDSKAKQRFIKIFSHAELIASEPSFFSDYIIIVLLLFLEFLFVRASWARARACARLGMPSIGNSCSAYNTICGIDYSFWRSSSYSNMRSHRCIAAVAKWRCFIFFLLPRLPRLLRWPYVLLRVSSAMHMFSIIFFLFFFFVCRLLSTSHIYLTVSLCVHLYSANERGIIVFIYNNVCCNCNEN